jgi:hypothetical protein
MKRTKLKHPARILISMGGCIICALGILWCFFAIQAEFEKNPRAWEAYEQGDYARLQATYVQGDLAVEERPWHGRPDAPVVVILVVDVENPASAELFNVFRDVASERVKQGIIRYAIKYHIEPEEYGVKSEGVNSFIYAAISRCRERQELQKLQEHHAENSALDTVPDTVIDELEYFMRSVNNARVQETGIEGETVAQEWTEALENCANEASLREDVFHTETQRSIAPSILVGTDTKSMTALYGAPDPDNLEQTIRLYEIRFGI